MDIDLPSVGQGDLDLVVRIVVTDLGLRHASSTRLGERGLGRAGEGAAADRLLVVVP